MPVLNDQVRSRIEAIAGDSTLGNATKRDQIYTLLAERAGLTGKAFFGHRKSKAEAKRLRDFWNMTFKFVPEVHAAKVEITANPPQEVTEPT